MSEQQTFTVGEVAAMAGVTVRTLHHYEEVGLVVPSRSPSGYRHYDESHIDRLTRALYYRELGLPLPEITSILDDPATDTAAHLRRHRDLVRRRLARLTEVLASIEKELEAHRMGTRLSAEEKLEIFGEGYDPAWETEAEERWGGTAAWRAGQQSAAALSKEDWMRVKADGDALMARFAEAFDAGVAATTPQAMDLAEQHRRSVEAFYPCSHEQHRCIAQTYVSDPRLLATYDAIAPGLAQWVHDAVQANADAHGAGPASEADWG